MEGALGSEGGIWGIPGTRGDRESQSLVGDKGSLASAAIGSSLQEQAGMEHSWSPWGVLLKLRGSP